MEYYTDESDNDLDKLMDKDENEYEGESANEADEALEDNSHNYEENLEGNPPPPPKPAKVKRPVLNPQPKLNFEALQGPKGLLALNELFKDYKFRGSGYETEDLGDILCKLEQWAFRLFPKFHFEDSLKRFEALGKKREVQVYLRKIRRGMLDNDVVSQIDEDDDDTSVPAPVPATEDRFDQLISQQIASTQAAQRPTLTDEQMARIERNRKLAMERKLQKVASQQSYDLSQFSQIVPQDVQRAESTQAEVSHSNMLLHETHTHLTDGFHPAIQSSSKTDNSMDGSTIELKL